MRLGHGKAGDITARVNDLGLALGSAGDRLSAEVQEAANTVLARARERIDLSADYTMVALAGQTGAGKSAVFNRLAGTDLAATGATRPTTSHPLAAVAQGTIPSPPSRLLRWLEVSSSHELPTDAQHPQGLLLLDLPDHDSLVAEHRLRADHVTERADLLIWVTSPQKYADATLHARYLQPLADHDETMVVVLNQIDRLSVADQRACLADLRRLVATDGLQATVLGASALTGEGIPELQKLISAAVRRRDAANAKLTSDLRHAATMIIDDLAPTTALVPAAGSVPVQRSRDRLLAAMESGAGVPTVVEAVRVSSIRDAVQRTGWPPVRWLQRFRADPLATLGLRPSNLKGSTAAEVQELRRTSLPSASPAVTAQIASAARTFVAAASATLPARLGERVNAMIIGTVDGLAEALDRSVIKVVQIRPARWWTVVGFSQWLLLAVALIGAGWLGGLALLDYLRFDVGDGLLPRVQLGDLGVPLPTVMLVGGLGAGVVLALLSRWFAGWGARRRARRTRAILRTGVEQVATERIVGRVDGELAAVARARSAAAEAAR